LFISSKDCLVKILKSFGFSLALLAIIGSIFARNAAAQTDSSVKPLTIERIYTPGEMTGRGPETIEWSPDGTKLSYVQRDEKGDGGELWYMDAATGEKKVLVSAANLAKLAPDYAKVKNEREKERLTRYHVAAYLWAPDSKHLIFDSQGQLWLYDLGSNTAVQFTSAPDPSGDPKFSPDGNLVSYVRKHNLYVQPASGKGEKQLTKDTGENLFNGDIDWVYAEELAVRSNYFWSPNSKELAFLHMDETKVPVYPITDWMPTHPTVDNEKYPKVGDVNPTVKLGVVNAGGGKIRWITLGHDADAYVPRFGWVRDGVMWAEVLNRTQDKLDLYFVDAKSGKSRIVLTETTPGAWIDFDHVEARFLKSGGGVIWPSWRDGNMHLYLYSFDKQNPMAADAKLERQLTSGDFQVLGIDGVDEASGTVFFSTNKDDPRQVHIYSVKLDGSGMQALTHEEGIHFAEFADDGKHYTETYSDTLTPAKTSLCAVGGACNPMWEARGVSEYNLAPTKFLEFKAEDGTTLYGRLLLPPNAPADGKIPLIVNIYGGPAGQMVLKGWGGASALFDQILVRKGFAIFAVDNRGTPGRDRKFQTAIRHEFGAVELRDQLTAIDQLLAQYPQLDKDRMAIWGWSNGGSMTIYAMTHSDRFRAGVAVAPVANQLDYDSIYTERYMGLAKEDAKGYEESDVTKYADKLHGELLLVHGTSDDNVHFQNTIQMIDALIKADKHFQLMIYPNKTHSIAGKDSRVHLFEMIEAHFERELK
jgi:dipeptidyl-peptidase 4